MILPCCVIQLLFLNKTSLRLTQSCRMKCLAKSTGDNGFYPEGSSPNFASNIKDTLKAFGNFKNKQSVRSNVF